MKTNLLPVYSGTHPPAEVGLVHNQPLRNVFNFLVPAGPLMRRTDIRSSDGKQSEPESALLTVYVFTYKEFDPGASAALNALTDK